MTSTIYEYMRKPSERIGRLIFFTISSRNYMSYAGVLFSSIKKFYPQADFFLALADSDEGIAKHELPYTLLNLFDLEDNRVWTMAEKYNVTEFNTALKPFVFSLLMERYPDATILYFDPDILLVSPLDELMAEFDKGANCVLTPHLLQPTNHPFSRDEDILKYGIYNLGFIAMRANEETFGIAKWWSDRMENRCLIDFPNGLFVDQKWCDLIPAYLDKTVVLRHAGYNIAYWNLIQRRIRLRDGEWFSNEDRVRFVHFSGFDPLNPSIVSRHGAAYHHMMVNDLSILLEYYRERLFTEGLRKFGRFDYAFRYSGSTGAVNVHTTVSLFSRLKGDRGMVDHPLPAFGPLGKAVADSEGNIDSGDISCLSFDSANGLNDYLASKTQEERDRRGVEKRVLGARGDIAMTEGVCAVCCTTTPFLTEVSTKSGLRSAEWAATLQCRCGHTMGTRALVHAMKSNSAGQSIERILVDGVDDSLSEWASLRFSKWEEISCKRTETAQIMLAELSDDAKGFTDELMASYSESLDDSGLLFVLSTKRGSVDEVVTFAGHAFSSLNRAGFIDSSCSLFWSQDYGYLGSNNLMFMAKKPQKNTQRGSN